MDKKTEMEVKEASEVVEKLVEILSGHSHFVCISSMCAIIAEMVISSTDESDREKIIEETMEMLMNSINARESIDMLIVASGPMQ